MFVIRHHRGPTQWRAESRSCTATPLPRSAGSARRKRHSTRLKGYCPCCVMVIAVPVIVRVAVRAAPVFAATANCTVPFPEPEAP